jgi:hypothetical protein
MIGRQMGAARHAYQMSLGVKAQLTRQIDSAFVCRQNVPKPEPRVRV